VTQHILAQGHLSDDGTFSYLVSPDLTPAQLVRAEAARAIAESTLRAKPNPRAFDYFVWDNQ
jgi:hypothetical protein